MSLPKKLLLVFIIIGLVDSLYLTAVHYTTLPFYCPEGAGVNCENVVTSPLSEVAGIPISIGGIVWFAVMGIMVLVQLKLKIVRNVWYIFALGAVAYSLIGQGILGEICEYCILLDVMLVLSVVIAVRYKAALFPS